MKPFFSFFFSLFIIYLPLKASTPQWSEGQSIFDYFKASDFTKLTIKSDFDQFITKGRKIELDQPASLELRNETGASFSAEIEIEPRGKFRRMNCDIPPMKLKFSKSFLSENGFNPNFKKYKLVTECKEGGGDAVLREYWAYKLYNQITEKSFRVHMVELTLIDVNTQNEWNLYAFIIESNNQLEERIGSEFEEVYGLNKNSLDSKDYCTTVLFQYMVGNTDWLLETNKNLKVVKKVESDKYMIIPYDFDFTGMVNANYAVPNINFKQRNVKQRIVTNKISNGKCLAAVGAQFMSIFGDKQWIFENDEHLSPESKEEMTEYLNEFVKLLGNSKKLNKLFL